LVFIKVYPFEREGQKKAVGKSQYLGFVQGLIIFVLQTQYETKKNRKKYLGLDQGLVHFSTRGRGQGTDTRATILPPSLDVFAVIRITWLWDWV
jgi:hypothetical protein